MSAKASPTAAVDLSGKDFSGKDLAAVASDLLEEAVRRTSVDELLAPVRRQVAESGMSDQAVDSFFRDVLKEVRDEKRVKRK